MNKVETELLLEIQPRPQTPILRQIPTDAESKPKGISKNSLICGGDACIDGTRIPVWGLVESRRLGISESQLLDDYPHIKATDLANAWIYAETYPDEIEIAIKKNQEV